MLELSVVSKLYVPRPGGRVIQALSDVSFHVAPGEIAALVGPAGAGKSTVLRLLWGEEDATRGTVLVNGEDVGALGRRGVARLRRRLGVVPQAPRLCPGLTAVGQVTLVLRALGVPRREARTRALAALRDAGLAARAHALPEELAAGERQRLALARALALDPAVLLADEPVLAPGEALDSPAAREVIALVRAAHVRGATVLVATQAAALADALKARPLLLESGRLAAAAPPPTADGAS
jgi:cell division transport system ATP-binding protein